MAKKKSTPQRPRGVYVRNRKAQHDFHITEVVECGIALTGTEVKSLRDGQAKIDDAFARVYDGEVFLVGANIAAYKQAAEGMNHKPTRERKLLLRKRQIHQIETHVHQKGKTLVPLAMYFKRGWAKVELGLAVGKRQYDKRDAIRRREQQRDIARQIRRR